MIINGGSVKSPAWREVVREFGKHRALFYAQLTSLFLTSIDREHGTIMHWPFSGGLLDQPCGTREAWCVMQNVYFRKIMADMDRVKRKGGK